MVEANGFSEESLRKIAEQKVNYRRSVKIHWSLYLLTNLLLFIINFFTTGWRYIAAPIQEAISHFWAFYPLLGWFVGLAIHTVAYLLYANGVYPMAKRGVFFHFTAYLTTIFLLTMINFMTLPTFYWVVYPALFWGLGFVTHLIVYMVYYKGELTEEGEAKSKKEKAVEREMEKMRKKMKKQT